MKREISFILAAVAIAWIASVPHGTKPSSNPHPLDREVAAAKCALDENAFKPETFPAKWETLYRTDAKFLTKCKTLVKKDGVWDLSPENRFYLNKNLDNLRGVWTMLKQDYFEMDHSIKRMFMALLMGTHAYYFGEPGAAKSAIAEIALHLPHYQLYTKGSKTEVRKFNSYYGLQLNQMTNEAVMKGWSDLGFNRNSEEYVNMRKMIRTENTVIEFENVLLDEIDKANPVAAAAALDVLNERIARHGGITLKARTKTVVATSNMTVYEFMEAMEEAGMGSTARALLDRLPFKVFHANQFADPKNEMLYSLRKAELDERKREHMGANPAIYGEDLEVVDMDAQYAHLPDVDFSFLSIFLPNIETVTPSLPFKTRESMNTMVTALSKEINDLYVKRQETTAADAASKPRSLAKPVYAPSWIFSIRNKPLISKGITASLFLDLAFLPEEKMPRPALELMMRRGIPVDLLSTWRIQDMVAAAAPGDPRLSFEESGVGMPSKLKLRYGPEIEYHLGRTTGRVKTMLEYIKAERDDVASVWETKINDHLKRGWEYGEHLAPLYELLGIQEEPVSIEILLARIQNEMNPLPKDPAPEAPAGKAPAKKKKKIKTS